MTCAATATGRRVWCGAPRGRRGRGSRPRTCRRRPRSARPDSATLPTSLSDARWAPTTRSTPSITPACDELARPARRLLLGVLEDEPHLAGELVAPAAQQLRRPEQHRRVPVVAAGVHDAGPRRTRTRARSPPGSAARPCRPAARARFPGRAPRSVATTRRRRRPLELEPVERAQRLLDEARRLDLLERQLGMRVQVAPPGDRLLLELGRDERARLCPDSDDNVSAAMTEQPPTDLVTMDKIVSLCRRRGFVFPSSEIYGGLGSSFDYGHYGVLAKNNIRERWLRGDGAGARRHRRARLGDHPPPAGLGGVRPRRGLHRPARRLPHLQDALPGRPPRGRAVRPQAVEAARRDARLRPDRGAPVQPHVRDDRRRRSRRRAPGLPAPRDRAGHLHQLQERAPDRAPQAAVRHRADRQVVPERDHARQLPLPRPRVRADGDGVLRPAGGGRGVVPLLDRRALRLVSRARPAAEPPARPRARRRRALALLERHERHRVPVSRSAGRSSRASRTAATTTSRATPSSRRRSSSTSTRTASATRRT